MKYHLHACTTMLIALCVLSGCASDQIVKLEAEREVLDLKVKQQQKHVEALEDAIVAANDAGDDAEKKQLDAALVLVRQELEKSQKAKVAIETVLASVTKPEDVVAGAGAVVAPLVPPPFNFLIPLLKAAVGGEISRRRGNAKVRKVAEVLESTGAVRFTDDQQARAANELMGSGLNAEIARGRSEAQKKVNQAEKLLNLRVGSSTTSAGT